MTTHDLPTIAGLWTGSDLKAQQEMDLHPNVADTLRIRERVRKFTGATDATPLAEVIERVHEALSAAPSSIVTATLDDALAVEERPNVPGPTSTWPNWSLSLPQPLEEIETAELPAKIARAMAARQAKALPKAASGQRRARS